MSNDELINSRPSIKIEIVPGGDHRKVINLEVRPSSDTSVQEAKESEKPRKHINRAKRKVHDGLS